MSTKTSPSKLFRSGIGFLVPVFIVGYFISFVGKMFSGIGKAVFGIKNMWLGGIVFIVVVVVAGFIVENTTIIDKIEKRLKKRPFLLKFFNFLFGRRNMRGMYEIYFYLSPEIRIKGIVTAEFSDGDEEWIIVNFSSPPTPAMGTTLIEIKKDDPRIEITGRPFTAYAAYIISYGTSDRNGNGNNK